MSSASASRPTRSTSDRAPAGAPTTCASSGGSPRRHLRSASFCDLPIDDEGLAELVAAASIERLVLQNTRLSNDGLRHLARLPALTDLRLKDNPQLDDACVRHLGALPRLTALQVHETSITAAGLVGLAPLAELRDLCVDEETGSSAALRDLSIRLPGCEILIKGRGILRAGCFDGDGA